MPKPFDLDQLPATAWASDLRPIGEGTAEKESFESWWERCRSRLSHLPTDLAEQWVYRHWLHSPFAFLPLNTLRWERRTWDGATLLGSIFRAWGGGRDVLDPEFDYDAFQGQGGNDRLATARALDSGTWDYPMILLSTPNGVVDLGMPYPDVRLVIVEGHQRHRYLNALHALGRPPVGPHETIMLHSPLISEASHS